MVEERLPRMGRSAEHRQFVAEERRRSLWRGYGGPFAEVFEEGPIVVSRRQSGEEVLVESSVALQLASVREVLLGCRDERSVLSKVRGVEHVIRTICTRVAETERARFVVSDGVFAAVVGKVKFPASRGRSCNMMPIVIGDVDSVPAEYRDYLPLLAACPVSRDDWGEIGYLTVDERDVEAGASHRRPGLHVEAPGLGLGHASFEPDDSHGLTLAWGRGYYLDDGAQGHFQGGLFLASTVPDSTHVFNCRPADDADVGPHGDLESLRPFMPPGFTLPASTLLWLTDHTPHESLPLPTATHRQFFRLVTSRVDAWYADHSTPNPLGVEPPPGVAVIRGNKFLHDPSSSSA
mmetsp:Transcript_14416/g.45438  ORF Transcript_14416/g.45438 Transcript_14416/m.45438 type:complete len:349 (+) Transcript_14416:12-1058(+)